MDWARIVLFSTFLFRSELRFVPMSSSQLTSFFHQSENKHFQRKDVDSFLPIFKRKLVRNFLEHYGCE